MVLPLSCGVWLVCCPLHGFSSAQPLLAARATKHTQVLMNFVMVCSMSVTSPLILPFGLLYFVGLWAVWRCAEGGGVLWCWGQKLQGVTRRLPRSARWQQERTSALSAGYTSCSCDPWLNRRHPAPSIVPGTKRCTSTSGSMRAAARWAASGRPTLHWPLSFCCDANI